MKWYHSLPSCKFVFALCFVWYLIMLSISKIIQHRLMDESMRMEYQGNDKDRGNWSTQRKNLLQCHLSNQNPTQTRPDWTQACAVTGQWLTAWFMAWTVFAYITVLSSVNHILYTNVFSSFITQLVPCKCECYIHHGNHAGLTVTITAER